MKTEHDKALSWFESLSPEEQLEVLKTSGYKEETELSFLIGKRKNTIKALHDLQVSFLADISELTDKIESMCQHDWTESEFLYDDHDGWSKVKITSTYRCKCKVCGKVNTFTKTSSF